MMHSPQARTARLAAFLDDRLGMEACDEASISRALLLVAEQDGMDEVAKACGVGPATLRRQLNGAFPLYVVTLFHVTRALGLQLRVEAIHETRR